jgi:hypothetical protein
MYGNTRVKVPRTPGAGDSSRHEWGTRYPSGIWQCEGSGRTLLGDIESGVCQVRPCAFAHAPTLDPSQSLRCPPRPWNLVSGGKLGHTWNLLGARPGGSSG